MDTNCLVDEGFKLDSKGRKHCQTSLFKQNVFNQQNKGDRFSTLPSSKQIKRNPKTGEEIINLYAYSDSDSDEPHLETKIDYKLGLIKSINSNNLYDIGNAVSTLDPNYPFVSKDNKHLDQKMIQGITKKVDKMHYLRFKMNLKQSDPFTCAICMDIIEEPVSLFCKHNFCVECL